MKDGHYGPKKLNKLHKSINGLNNGACLTGHMGNFSKFGNKKTCNYRYQAYERAKAGDVKGKLHSYARKEITADVTTSAYKTQAGKRNPAHYCARIAPPRKGQNDWHVGGPKTPIVRKKFSGQKVTIPATMNFTQDTWPYWNNAHHLIPKGTLKARISEEKARVSVLIQQSLLEAKYNINFKVNMLMMPQDREVAAILGIPRHIQLKENDEATLAAMCTDHPVYNQMVKEMKSGLNTIVKDYVAICDKAIKKADKKHEEPKATLSKAKLESLSRKLMSMILNWGSSKKGKKMAKQGPSLDKLAKTATA